MAKRKKKAATAVPADAHLGLLHGAQSQFDDASTFGISLLAERHVGLPLQCLALEYLFGSDKLILGKSYGISGPPESFKSSLQLDFMRHIVSFSGAGFLVETEGEKISAPMVQSACGAMAERITMRSVDSVDAAQRALTWVIEWLKKTYPDRNYLVAVGLDSISGAATEERGAKIKKEGAAQRDYSSEALLWTQWLKTYASKISGWPLTLMYVNHEKPKQSDPTGHGKSKAGGLAQDFYATVYMSIARVKEQKGSTKTLTQLRIRTAKNSFGEHRRAIDTLFVYDHSGPVGKMYFDWPHATAQLLIEHKAHIKDLVDVSASSDTMTSMARAFSCRQLGLKAVSAEDLALAVGSNEELVGELRKILGINDYAEWDGAMPLPESDVVEPKVCPEDEADDA